MLRPLAIEGLYDGLMGGVTQVAFQIDDRSLTALDALVAERYRSRAEVIRLAVQEWLARAREQQVDAALARGYEAEPAGDEERSWAELSVEGLRAGDLDW